MREIIYMYHRKLFILLKKTRQTLTFSQRHRQGIIRFTLKTKSFRALKMLNFWIIVYIKTEMVLS